MVRLLALALVAQLGACSEPAEPFPINPGGGGGTGIGSGARPDAAADASDAGDASTTITARVCLLFSDVQTLAGCATTGAGGLSVELDGETATTADDGTFTIVRPAGDPAGLVWRISGTNVKDSAVRFGDFVSLPVIAAPAYDDMLAATEAAIGNGDGALIVRVSRAGVAVAGAVVVPDPPATNQQIFYDGVDQTAWETTATGIQGVAWIPSQPAGTTELAITVDQTVTVVTGIPMFQDTITFALAEIP